MLKFISSFVVCLTAVVFCTNLGLAEKPQSTEDALAAGKSIYDKVCYICHGSEGKGDGPSAFFMAAYLAPRPRDFTVGTYKFRTTPTGEMPSDEDLFRTVTNGVPGFMPSFQGLSESERWEVIFYIKSMSSAFAETPAVDPIVIDNRPAPTASSIQRGREVYKELKCWDCHGHNGLGDGPSTNNMFDDLKMKMFAQDLTKPFTFRGGDTPEDIYRTFMTGLNGTPMPSYAKSLEGREKDAWHMVNYILSLARPKRPTP